MRVHIILLSILFLAGGSLGQCGTPGQNGIPEVSLQSDLVGRDTFFTVKNGAPLADWVCFFDTNAGPTVTPFGTICLGSAPSLIFSTLDGSAANLDANGAVAVPVSLPVELGIVEGASYHLQAMVADATAPLGVSISNGATISFRRPRVFLGASVAGPDFLISIEPTSGTMDFSSTVSGVPQEILHSPETGRVVMVGIGAVNVFDDETGALLNSYFYTSLSPVSDVAISHDGQTLMLLEAPPFSFVPNTSTPSTLRVVDLATGNETSYPVSHSATELIPHPSQHEVYIADLFGTLVPTDYTTGAQAAPIVTNLSALSYSGTILWTIDGNIITVANSGVLPTLSFPGSAPAMVAIDMTTNAPLAPAVSLPMSATPVTDLVSAVGTSGLGIFLQTATGLREFSPITFNVRQTIVAPGHVARSSGGGELLILSGTSLKRFDLMSNTLSTVLTGLATQSSLEVAPGGAYFMNGNDLNFVTTDPAGVSSSITTLSLPFVVFPFVIKAE